MKKKTWSLLITIILFAIITFLNEGTVENESVNNNIVMSGTVKIHYIDVGQADSILIQSDEKAMLIDAGNNGDSEAVVEYIKAQGIKTLTYVIGTHPHEDHIGGLDAVIESFDIDQVYMPKAKSTTKTFEDVLKAISNKGLKVTTPIPRTNLELGSAKLTILAPNSSSYEETNNHSIVIKLSHRNNSFLFTGDAEDVSEKEMIGKGFDLSADVLKVGHHGSSSSTTKDFLDRVNPKYAVISVGKDNDYGHPHKETIDRLNEKGIIVYRTDEKGTVVATSDGDSIIFD